MLPHDASLTQFLHTLRNLYIAYYTQYNVRAKQLLHCTVWGNNVKGKTVGPCSLSNTFLTNILDPCLVRVVVTQG